MAPFLLVLTLAPSYTVWVTQGLLTKGLTLRPVPAEYISAPNGFRKYLTDIHRELRQYRAYMRSSLPLLVWCLDHALEMEYYLAEDLEMLLIERIQFVRLWLMYFKRRWQPRFVPHITREDDPDGKMPDHVPNEFVSEFLDFLFFCCETGDPSFNLLTKQRIRYDVGQWRHGEDYDGSPVQELALIRWRRHLLEKEAFQCDTAELMATLGPRSYWTYLAPLPDESSSHGTLFLSREGIPSRVRLMPSKGYLPFEVLLFARKYRLEMVGTYASRKWRSQRLHFLPQRVHVRRTTIGVSVFMPDFYSVDTIRTLLTKDFDDLRIALSDKPETWTQPKTTTPIKPKDRSRLGFAIRRSMRADNHSDEVVAGVLKLLGRKMGQFDLDRIYSSSVPDEPANVGNQYGAVLRDVHAAMLRHETDEYILHLWHETLRFFAMLGLCSVRRTDG